MTSGLGTGYRLYALVDEEQRELAMQLGSSSAGPGLGHDEQLT